MDVYSSVLFPSDFQIAAKAYEIEQISKNPKLPYEKIKEIRKLSLCECAKYILGLVVDT